MAEFFQRFDRLPLDHSHGNLTAHYGLLLLYGATGNRQYLGRTLARWEEAVGGGYVWPLGGVGEKFHVSGPNDEGCSEADWLRVNLELWRLTGQARFLEMSERLLWNHYAMNRTANGGYGHHNFIADAEGPLSMEPQFTEAVWCCTFHGLLGLELFKRHVVAGSDAGVRVNFPVEATARVRAAGGTWTVSVSTQEGPGEWWRCRVRIDPQGARGKTPAVWFRRPGWADGVSLADRRGRTLRAVSEDGCLRLAVRPGAEGEVTVSFRAPVALEDRRLNRLVTDGKSLGRHRGVVLRRGPRILFANAARPRPVVVAPVDADGQVLLSRNAAGTWCLPVVERLDATPEQFAAAAKAGPRLDLAPWDQARHDIPEAFVFDLVTVPADSPLGQALR
jgi:hypothetical protein